VTQCGADRQSLPLNRRPRLGLPVGVRRSNTFFQPLIHFYLSTEFPNEFGRECRLFQTCPRIRDGEPSARRRPTVTTRILQSFLSAALLLSAAFCSAQADAQQTFPQQTARVISFAPAENVKELYVAVMGEVATPGTYRLEPAALKLHSLVRRAGGLTSEASLTIRVIRQGRFNQNLLFSDKVDSPVMPGDLLIVNSRQLSGNVSKVIDAAEDQSTTIRAVYHERSAQKRPTGVQVALLNVLDYPLVLKLRPEEANVEYLIQTLGQHIELLANTHVITPDVFPRQSSETAKRSPRLSEGTVLVFEKGRIQRDRLPATLPKPIESEIAMGAQSSLIGMPHGQSPELRNLGQQMIATDNSSFDENPQFSRRTSPTSTPSRAPESELSPDHNRPDFPTPMVSTRPRIANVPYTGSSRITNSSAGSSRSPNQPAGDLIPAPDDSDDLHQSGSDKNVESSPAGEISTPASTTFSLTHLAMIFLIVGTLVGAAVLLRRALESLAPNETSAAPAVVVAHRPAAVMQTLAAKSLLERLIKNELPITIEPADFPDGIVLQGRIAARPILRVDSPQNVIKQNGPHFAKPEETTSELPLADVIAQVDGPDVNPVRRPHFMGASQQKVSTPTMASHRTGEIEPATTGGQSQTPLAKALFQLEQGGRA
jgi:hypothetical protein